jgi:Protein of unknown function (DUF4038)/Putative collagen-binding domain of a collagenase
VGSLPLLRDTSRRFSFALLSASFALLTGCSSNPAGASAIPSFPSAEQITTASAYAYPLKISKNARYLMDQNNKPFRIQGDSAQSLIANLTYPEAEAYFSDRQAKGFNTININLLEHKFALRAPANRNGDPPFTSPGDFSKPNERYFAFADSIIDLAASKGMLISLAPMYLGASGGDEGWWTALIGASNSQEVCYNFGLYIGNRYKYRKNILWVIGGDYTPPSGSEGEARLHKFMEGIKAAGATQLWAGDWDSGGISTDEPAFSSSMDLNAVYTYGKAGKSGATYAEARKAFTYSPPRPAYLKETGYESENWVEGAPASVRKYAYRAILGGCTAGAFFGHRDIWEFATSKWWSGFNFGHASWQSSLNSAGTFDMVRLGKLLDALPWFDLVPSGLAGTKNFVTQGGGNYEDADYVTVAATADAKVLLAYIPPAAKNSVTFTVDLALLNGSARARWFDPASGKYTEISPNSLQNRGARSFTTPGKNAAGATDWVLVLQVVPGQNASPDVK